jgi:hypothetical protein
MKTVLLALILGALGGVVGYLAGIYLACDFLWPESNLCGLVGVFVTAPLGIVIGIVAGVVIGRRPPR